MAVMTTPTTTAAAIPTIVLVPDPPSTSAVAVVVALVTFVTIEVVTISVLTDEDVLTVDDVTVDDALTVDDVTVEDALTVEDVLTVDDVTVEDVLTVEDGAVVLVTADVLVSFVILTSHVMPVVKGVHRQANPTDVDGLHVAPAPHGRSSQDILRSQYQPPHKGSHVHSIPVSMPTRSVHVPPFMHGELMHVLCFGHRNVSLDMRPLELVASLISDVDR